MNKMMLIFPGFLAMTLSAATAPAQQVNFQERFANIYKIGLGVSDFVHQADRDLMQIRAAAVGDEETNTADRMFCFTPKSSIVSNTLHFPALIFPVSAPVGHNKNKTYPEGTVAYNDWPAKHFKNADDPRCAKYRLETYKDEERIEAIKQGTSLNEFKGGYIVNVEQILARAIVKKALQEKYMPQLEQVRADSLSKLAALIRDANATPLERSLAVAVQSVVAKKTVGLIKSYGIDAERTIEFEDTMAYLAVNAGDWLSMTGGNLDVYREFKMEIDMSELSAKVDQAMALAQRSLEETRQINRRLDRTERNAMLKSGAFWGIAGTLGFGLLLR